MSAVPGTAAVALEDLALAQRCAARETAAIRQVVTVNNQRLFRTARAVLGNDGEAEDVVQAAYVRAFTHLDGFKGDAQFSTCERDVASDRKGD